MCALVGTHGPVCPGTPFLQLQCRHGILSKNYNCSCGEYFVLQGGVEGVILAAWRLIATVDVVVDVFLINNKHKTHHKSLKSRLICHNDLHRRPLLN